MGTSLFLSDDDELREIPHTGFTGVCVCECGQACKLYGVYILHVFVGMWTLILHVWQYLVREEMYL